MAVANSVEKAMLRWVARDPRVRFSLHLKVGVTARAEGGRGACGGFLFWREAPRGLAVVGGARAWPVQPASWPTPCEPQASRPGTRLVTNLADWGLGFRV